MKTVIKGKRSSWRDKNKILKSRSLIIGSRVMRLQFVRKIYIPAAVITM